MTEFIAGFMFVAIPVILIFLYIWGKERKQRRKEKGDDNGYV